MQKQQQQTITDNKKKDTSCGSSPQAECLEGSGDEGSGVGTAGVVRLWMEEKQCVT